jgi:hypothetical protein
MLNIRAFIALETTVAATMRSGWNRQAARHLAKLEPLLAAGQWDLAHEYVGRLTLNGVVADHFNRLEELAVSSVLFGAQNVSGALRKVSYVTGSRDVPLTLQQALGHMRLMVERDGSEQVRKALHAAIRVEELVVHDEPVPVEKEERSLYIHRPLLNGVQLIAWAREQGLPSILEEHDLHVTVAFSRDDVEWDDTGFDVQQLLVQGGRRQLKKFGKALVLAFGSDHLQARWDRLREIGASWDHPSYQPHVTISYRAEDVDIGRIEPFAGDLLFGAEVLSEVKEDWGGSIRETKLRKAEMTLAQRLNAAVMGTGGAVIDVGANLTTSRLVSLGFLAEAVDNTVEVYQVNEQLDEKTCPVCMYMHGKTFRVGQEYGRLLSVLGTTDPQELRAAAPWPSRTQKGLQALYGMSLEEMQAAGYGSPPYHPGCRGVPQMVGTVEETYPLGSLSIHEAILPIIPAPTPPIPLAAIPAQIAPKPANWLDLINQIKSQKQREKALLAWADNDLTRVRELLDAAGLPVD